MPVREGEFLIYLYLRCLLPTLGFGLEEKIDEVRDSVTLFGRMILLKPMSQKIPVFMEYTVP
jgi:hypothetical protein